MVLNPPERYFRRTSPAGGIAKGYARRARDEGGPATVPAFSSGLRYGAGVRHPRSLTNCSSFVIVGQVFLFLCLPFLQAFPEREFSPASRSVRDLCTSSPLRSDLNVASLIVNSYSYVPPGDARICFVSEEKKLPPQAQTRGMKNRSRYRQPSPFLSLDRETARQLAMTFRLMVQHITERHCSGLLRERCHCPQIDLALSDSRS